MDKKNLYTELIKCPKSHNIFCERFNINENGKYKSLLSFIEDDLMNTISYIMIFAMENNIDFNYVSGYNYRTFSIDKIRYDRTQAYGIVHVDGIGFKPKNRKDFLEPFSYILLETFERLEDDNFKRAK